MRIPRFNAVCKQVISMASFIFVSCTIASAYTIVFYGGKRVEIPDNFVVTSNAVIYEAAPGVNVSFPLKSIDVPATERANNNSSGSLLRRIGAQRVQALSTTVDQKTTRTITNRDLEPYERARVRSEETWEKRRKELGLPSLEETRREATRRETALDEFLARKRLEEDANYWREREAELLAEMAARKNATDYQAGQYFWPGGIVVGDNGVSSPFGSRFRFGRGFPFGLKQGSPCGFNPSASCLFTHPFSLFKPGAFRARRTIFVAPRTNFGVRPGRGVFVSPGRRH